KPPDRRPPAATIARRRRWRPAPRAAPRRPREPPGGWGGSSGRRHLVDDLRNDLVEAAALDLGARRQHDAMAKRRRRQPFDVVGNDEGPPLQGGGSPRRGGQR